MFGCSVHRFQWNSLESKAVTADAQLQHTDWGSSISIALNIKLNSEKGTGNERNSCKKITRFFLFFCCYLFGSRWHEKSASLCNKTDFRYRHDYHCVLNDEKYYVVDGNRMTKSRRIHFSIQTHVNDGKADCDCWIYHIFFSVLFVVRHLFVFSLFSFRWSVLSLFFRSLFVYLHAPIMRRRRDEHRFPKGFFVFFISFGWLSLLLNDWKIFFVNYNAEHCSCVLCLMYRKPPLMMYARWAERRALHSNELNSIRHYLITNNIVVIIFLLICSCRRRWIFADENVSRSLSTTACFASMNEREKSQFNSIVWTNQERVRERSSPAPFIMGKNHWKWNHFLCVFLVVLLLRFIHHLTHRHFNAWNE